MRAQPSVALLVAVVLKLILVTAHCPHDNLLRCFIRTPDLAITFCSWTVGIYPTASTIYATTTITPSPLSPTATINPSSTDSLVPIPSISSSSTEYVSITSITVTITVTVTDRCNPTKLISSWTTDTSSPESTQPSSTWHFTNSSSIVPSVTCNNTSTISGPPNGLPQTIIHSASNLNSFSETQTRTNTITVLATVEPNSISRRTGPKTSLACLDDLEPGPIEITSACSCFSESYTIPAVTTTITALPGPTCPGGQPPFPNCFDDFHPYNCGTDRSGVIACSCAETTEGTALCTLGDYERDNACYTSDDCANGWYCTIIDCFDDLPSVCTQACPRKFAVNQVGAGLFKIENSISQGKNLSIMVGGKA